jgi:CDP-glucose 4,6-dehydratase
MLNATHPYDLSKAAADMLCRGYAATYKLPVGITRCGNLYGGGDLNFNRVVPQTIRHLYFNENPIIRSDGTFLRDYFYIEDAVDAYIVFAENLLEKKLEGEAFNFGTEKPVSVIELVNKIIKIAGKEKLKPIIKNSAKGEIKDQYLSCKKARDILQWKPKHTLDEGLEKTHKWYTKWFAERENLKDV